MARAFKTHAPIALLRFAIVGAAGFAVDGGIMILLMARGYDIVPSRLLSFLIAVTMTWWLNRNWTFPRAKQSGRRQEYLGYMATQLTGAGINLGVFFLVIHFFPAVREYPLVPLAAGAVPALAFNFGISKFFVFARA